MYYMATSKERDEMMTLRLNADERKMVEALAATDGVSMSDAIRMAIRQRHAERFSKKGGK